MNIGIDANILIYAGIVPAKPIKETDKLKQLRLRAKLLLHQLQKDTLILPALAVSEILVPVPSSEKGILIAKLREFFVCPSFDLQAATIAAEIWAKHKKLPADQQYKQRHVLKADAQIVASAKVAGATEFYSADKKCRTLANFVMKGRDLPTRPDPTKPDALFIMDDIERGDL